LRDTIEEINELFKDDSIETDILLIGDEEGPIRTLPFLDWLEQSYFL